MALRHLANTLATCGDQPRDQPVAESAHWANSPARQVISELSEGPKPRFTCRSDVGNVMAELTLIGGATSVKSNGPLLQVQ